MSKELDKTIKKLKEQRRERLEVRRLGISGGAELTFLGQKRSWLGSL